MTRRILVAGVGNIFFGDDAFGVETVRQLMEQVLPEEVRVVDYGIRSYDLAYAMMNGYDVVILVDATTRGQAPGTIYLIEPQLDDLTAFDGQPLNSHSLNPMRVIEMAQSLGGPLGRIYLVGCEPEVLETEDGRIGLSPKVQAGVPAAIEIIQSLLGELLNKPTSLVEA